MADISGNQRRVLGEFLAQLQPHWHTEAGLPTRIERLIRSDRRFGSRDRRLYRELIYTTLRYLNWVEPWLGTDFGIAAIAWLAAELPATQAFRSAVLSTLEPPSTGGARPPGALDLEPRSGLHSNSPSSAPGLPVEASMKEGERVPRWPPVPLTVSAKAEILAARAGLARLPSLLPAWAPAECPAALEPAEYDTLHRRAPLWIRLQGDRPELVLEELAARHWPWRRSELLPSAIRVDAEADLTDTLAFQAGMIEIQDLGSQLILAAAAPAPGGVWLDACAGAGGKSLQLAALLGPAGRVEANDVRPAALAELARRAERAGLGARIQRARLAGAEGALHPQPLYDGVLVDAPCSGSGTWRRSPHLKAVTTAAQVQAAAALQLQLLTQFSAAVKPGGRLVYATCSLCVRENEGVAGQFLAAQPKFCAVPPAAGVPGQPAGPGLVLTPSSHDGDGFFVATFRRLP